MLFYIKLTIFTQQRFFWLPTICQSLSRHLELISELINNQFQCSSVSRWSLTLWDPMDCSMPSFPGWFWERLKAGGEGDDREWDGWMASLTQWTWVWASSSNVFVVCPFGFISFCIYAETPLFHISWLTFKSLNILNFLFPSVLPLIHEFLIFFLSVSPCTLTTSQIRQYHV